MLRAIVNRNRALNSHPGQFRKQTGRSGLFLLLLLMISIGSSAATRNRAVSLDIQLRGVVYCTVELKTYRDGHWQRHEKYRADAGRQGRVRFLLDSADLPGEFVIRYSYKVKAADDVYPAEQAVFISDQSIQVSVNPPFCNNADSVSFQRDERENTLWQTFSADRARKLRQLQLLRQLLLEYDHPQSSLYSALKDEYRVRQQVFNSWIARIRQKYTSYYIASLIQFSHVPEEEFTASAHMPAPSFVDAYLAKLDFSNPGIIHTSAFVNWLTAYVNIFTENVKTQAILDTVVKSAAVRLLEVVRSGHPLVYGFVVDYFYEGFERYGLTSATNVLAPYLQDPRCLTRKKREIDRRIRGVQKLKPGLALRAVVQEKEDGQIITHSLRHTDAHKRTLLVFYSTDCGHCTRLLSELDVWYKTKDVASDLQVITISVDDDRLKWSQYAARMKFAWDDGYAPDGINSETAADYFVLSTPAMFLSDHKARLLSQPADITELMAKEKKKE